MRSIWLGLAALSGAWWTAGVAQEFPNQELREQLCEQCPFDAPAIPIRRNDFSSPGSTDVVTAEEMRSLGVVSVADMINQLVSQSEQESASEPESVKTSADEQSAEPEEAEPAVSDD